MAAQSQPSNVLRFHNSMLCEVLNSSEATFNSLNKSLYEIGVIDHIVSDSERDNLLNLVRMKVDDKPHCLEMVFQLMEKEEPLQFIVKKMREVNESLKEHTVQPKEDLPAVKESVEQTDIESEREKIDILVLKRRFRRVIIKNVDELRIELHESLLRTSRERFWHRHLDAYQMVDTIDKCTTLSELEDKCSKFIMAHEETSGRIVRRIECMWRDEARKHGIELRLEMSTMSRPYLQTPIMSEVKTKDLLAVQGSVEHTDIESEREKIDISKLKRHFSRVIIEKGDELEIELHETSLRTSRGLFGHRYLHTYQIVDMIVECTTLSELEDKCSEFIMAHEETGGYVPHIVRRIAHMWRDEARELGIELKLEMSTMSKPYLQTPIMSEVKTKDLLAVQGSVEHTDIESERVKIDISVLKYRLGGVIIAKGDVLKSELRETSLPAFRELFGYRHLHPYQMLDMIAECTTLSELEDKCSKFIMAYKETGGRIVRRIERMWRDEARELGIELRLEMSTMSKPYLQTPIMSEVKTKDLLAVQGSVEQTDIESEREKIGTLNLKRHFITKILMLQPEYLRISPYALENLLELKDLIKKSTTLSELEDNCSKFIMDLEETGQYVRYLANEIEIKWRYEARRLGIELRLESSTVSPLYITKTQITSVEQTREKIDILELKHRIVEVCYMIEEDLDRKLQNTSLHVFISSQFNMVYRIRACTTLLELEDKCNKFLISYEESGRLIRDMAEKTGNILREAARDLSIEFRLEMSSLPYVQIQSALEENDDNKPEILSVDEKVFNLTGDKECTLDWDEYGLHIDVPEESLSDGQTTALQVKAIVAGDFIVPPDCHMISGIYWICCPERFHKRVILHISHAAIIESDEEASHFKFYAAKCSSGPPYEFKQLDGGTFTPFSTSASIQLQQFSFFGLGANRASRQRYCYQVFYKLIEGPDIEWEMFFLVTKDVPAFQECISKEYSDCVRHIIRRVKLQNDATQLKLVPETPTECCWTVTPVTESQIDREDIEYFTPKRSIVIPKCHFNFCWNSRSPVSRLELKIIWKELLVTTSFMLYYLKEQLHQHKIM